MAEVDPELVKRLAELVDAPPWEMADVLVEKFPIEDYPVTTGTGGGLYEALEGYEDALRKERGVVLKASTMRNYRATALAWPGAVRTAPAAFDAYSRLRGQDGQERMARYLKRNKGRPLSVRDVQRYRADDNPTPVKPWDLRAKRRIESTVKSLLLGGTVTKREDWWNVPGVDESRDALINMLFDLGTRMGQS